MPLARDRAAGYQMLTRTGRAVGEPSGRPSGARSGRQLLVSSVASITLKPTACDPGRSVPQSDEEMAAGEAEAGAGETAKMPWRQISARIVRAQAAGLRIPASDSNRVASIAARMAPFAAPRLGRIGFFGQD
jgi:hypothetical protein